MTKTFQYKGHEIMVFELAGEGWQACAVLKDGRQLIDFEQVATQELALNRGRRIVDDEVSGEPTEHALCDTVRRMAHVCWDDLSMHQCNGKLSVAADRHCSGQLRVSIFSHGDVCKLEFSASGTTEYVVKSVCDYLNLKLEYDNAIG